jgi:mono/diheme cytochrome c family protein
MRRFVFRVLIAAVGLAGLAYLSWAAHRPDARNDPVPAAAANSLDGQFTSQIQPLFERYCFGCHGGKKPKASLDLSQDRTVAAIAEHASQWELAAERLKAKEMPPAKAERQPGAGERAAMIGWIRELLDREARRHAGDPGIVLARRLSNAELDYTVFDLTGVDIRPAREFPVDPANEAGFDNSGESLAMSPPLVKKYLAASRLVASHVVLKPHGFVFAPHPVVTDTDRDKYCVKRIIDFYDHHKVDLADYFLAAWKFHHRDRLGQANVPLSAFARDAGLSSKYLAMICSVLIEAESESGPLAAVRKIWRELPAPAKTQQKGQITAAARAGCVRMRDFVVRLRGQLRPHVTKLHLKGISDGSQPFVLWRNRQMASRHRIYSGGAAADLRKLAEQVQATDAGLLPFFDLKTKSSEKLLRTALERFCNVFPDAFVVADRGPYFDPKAAGKGRPLTAGFHLMQGYFRDDQPLCELILEPREKQELDSLWDELNFITEAPLRQYRDFIFFERAEPPRFMFDAQFDFARSEDRDAVSQAKIDRLAAVYLVKAKKLGAKEDALQAIEDYFRDIAGAIRRVERGRLAAEPSHLEALVKFAERAYRRPLSRAEREDLLGFYRKLRREDVGHEEALNDALVSVFMSPHFCYRFDRAAGTRDAKASDDRSQPYTVVPLSDYALASRLSYFLWSSMPDEELLAHARAGDLHRPEVMKAQARRMLRDPRVRRLAAEFAGNWLDFRRFEEHNAVDRERFPSFTNELRHAMFEEPIRYLVDVAGNNRSILDLLYGKDTFVNGELARHYGMPEPKPGRDDSWVHIADARPFGRGGLLTMAVFLTKNAPGLRTSPVKRGYWVVRRLLGERIPPPPPTVPELPKDEASTGELTLPELLARHRADKNCAGCHQRFDAVGLVFENFGPVGERRNRDLGGRPVQSTAEFPDGKERHGVDGLRDYLREKRQGDFVANFCGKLFSYALGRSLILSDKPTLDDMRARLAVEGYRFGSLIESIVTSPQFLHRRVQEGK